MDWTTKILPAREDGDWPHNIDRLFEHQMAQWPLLRQNIRQVAAALTKPVVLGDFEVTAQCNPERRSSTTAKVDAASVRQRPCKLCPENLFPEQQGLAYGAELIILCNPYPILPRHLSIVHRAHTPQTLHARLPMLLDLARNLGDRFFLFYNGPQCGASAPDHFHVQACARERLPLFRHLRMVAEQPGLRAYTHVVRRDGASEIFTLESYHVKMLVYRSAHPDALVNRIDETIRALRRITDAPDEPLLNLVMWHDAAHDATAAFWTVCLFPRATHRPACYYDGTLVISPASLDMAGLLVFPQPEHFQALTPEHVRQVYAEVTLPAPLFARLRDMLNAA